MASSTSGSPSLPKNISLPTKKVGDPNAPRSTASCVSSIRRSLTSRCCAREQAVEVDIGGDERIARDLRVIHFLRLFPHVMIGGPEVGRKYALELGSNRAAHQLQ